MKIRKISATLLYTPSGFLRNGILYISQDGIIKDIQDTQGNLKEESGLEYYNGILCPGFINCHCHLELSHMKGKIPRYIGMGGFVEKVITGRNASIEDISGSISEADLEMQKYGIVAVGDISNTSDSFGVKSQSPIYYHSYIELFGTSDQEADSIYNNGQNLLNLARNTFHLNATITPHASYSLGNLLFSLISNNADPAGLVFSIHNQESSSEDDLIRNADGELYNTLKTLGFDMRSKIPTNMGSLQWLLTRVPHNARLLLVHNLFTEAGDIRLSGAAERNIYWVMCPRSNYYIGKKWPGTYLMENFSEKICIGTDSLASNDDLSVLNELIALQEAYPEISLHSLLSWGTINGSRALGIDDRCGSFEKGKKPGILLIENVNLQKLVLSRKSAVRLLN